MKIGLVTVLYNSNDVLEDFFKSLSIQTYTNFHLYLIDNKPTTEIEVLLTQLNKKYPIPGGYTHIKNPGNYGVARGNNQGIKLALADGADYVLLLNNDIEFTQPQLFKNMIDCAVEQNEEIIIPKILYYGTRIIWMAGGKFLKHKGFTIHVGENAPDGEKYNQPAYFDYAPTCFMLINKNVFNTVGVMDEQYFVYFDDSDFVYRAGTKKYKIYYMPSLEIFHKVSFSTGGSESLFTLYYGNRNRVYFIRKNFKFPVKQIALAYTIISRLAKWAIIKKDKRAELYRGFKEGFKMRLTQSVD